MSTLLFRAIKAMQVTQVLLEQMVLMGRMVT